MSSENKFYKFMYIQAKRYNHRLNGENCSSNTWCGLIKKVVFSDSLCQNATENIYLVAGTII